MNPIYLDYNATTPVAEVVRHAMFPYFVEHFGNPSSDHAFGRAAAEAVATARHELAQLINAHDDEIVFTSCATESTALAIRGRALHSPQGRYIVTSAIEHPATEKVCMSLEAQGFTLIRVGVDSEGQLDMHRVASLLRPDATIITVIHAHNETGVLQPVQAVVQAAKRLSLRVHTDASQSVGKVPVDVQQLGVDLMTMAGHKMYAPKGIGALFVRRGVELSALAVGGGQEHGLRSGTENVPYIVAFGAAAKLARAQLQQRMRHAQLLRDRLHGLLAGAVPGLRVNGHLIDRLPGTLSVRFPRVRGRALLEGVPEVAASTGSACHGTDERPPAAICAMGVSNDEALGTVRFSVGDGLTEADIDRAAAAIIARWKMLASATAASATAAMK